MKVFLQILILFLPKGIRKFLLKRFCGFSIHKDAYIGYSIILVDNFHMAQKSSIGHLNIFKGLELVSLGEFSSIGNLNWITAFPKSIESEHFGHQRNRETNLILGKHSSITNRHLIDCTSSISIGDFTTVAGFRSQFLTHSIDLRDNRQNSVPISIGNYCFIGTNAVFLPGATVPDKSIIAASSTVISKLEGEFGLFGGAPAKRIKDISDDYKYMNRQIGYVV
jgi:acetyltransferase-like isoleucine patch superfamily enzyme